MIDTKTLDDLAHRLSGLMPEAAKTFQEDMEKNLRAGLHGVFQKMDLVTREEFEVQAALLARSREKLKALEQRVQELEAALKDN